MGRAVSLGNGSRSGSKSGEATHEQVASPVRPVCALDEVRAVAAGSKSFWRFPRRLAATLSTASPRVTSPSWHSTRGWFQARSGTASALPRPRLRSSRAASVEISSTSGIVTVRDSGQAFGIDDLRADGKGGNRAILDLEKHASGTFGLVYRWEDGRNSWALVDEVLLRGEGSPCSIRLEYGAHREEAIQTRLRELDGCPEIHLYPGDLWSYSDWAMLLQSLALVAPDRAFVMHGVNENNFIIDFIIDFIAEFIPSARIAD